MKKTLLLIAALAVTSFGFSQTELVRNGTCDEHGTGSDSSNTSDNADAWDMTPNSTLNGSLISPYRLTNDNPTGWKNQTLEDALEVKYQGAEGGSLDEQPGSTSGGNNGTRGVKLYDDEDQGFTGSSRRLYQLVNGLTIGNTYNFSIDSKSEVANTPSEVYILNTQIADEVGIDANKYNDASVVSGMDITNDEGTWVTTTFSFVATTTEVVIYVRALAADAKDKQVFFDNISLKMATTNSTEDVFAANFGIYPNPAKNVINISSVKTIEKAEIYNIIGKKVISTSNLSNNSLDISSLTKGVYILKLVSGDVVGTRKIIKQ
jgi:hypothetical protein